MVSRGFSRFQSAKTRGTDFKQAGIRIPLFRFGNRPADFSDSFPFRLQPIFEVVTNEPAPGAMDLMSTVQDFFYAQTFPDCIFAEGSVFQFVSLYSFPL